MDRSRLSSCLRSRGRRSPGARIVSADRVMFPLAAAFALVAIPGWLVLRATSVHVPASWHGHEMLFGYAPAVVAGFLVTRASPGLVLALVTTWIAARVGTAAGGGLGAALAGLSFPAVLAAAAAPPLVRRAKRAENRIAPVVLVVLLLLDAIWWAGALWLGPAIQQRALLGGIDLLSLLMLAVGGRALPAAVGGYLERQGIPRADRIRSGYELPLAGLMAIALVSDLAGLHAIAGAFTVAAALVTLWRAAFWRLTCSLRRARLWTLALAYLWLIPALAIKGIAQLVPVIPVTQALHAFAIGALGSLTLVMMARTALLRMRRPLRSFTDIGVAVLLLSLSAALRLVAVPSLPARDIALWSAAGAWVVAFAILLVRLQRTYDGRRVPGREPKIGRWK